jgi:aminoglycoside phosphotransferase (APT) family kinase protein
MCDRQHAQWNCHRTVGRLSVGSTLAVVKGIRGALRAAGNDPGELRNVLEIADALLHRAAIEDDLTRRRSVAAHEVASEVRAALNHKSWTLDFVRAVLEAQAGGIAAGRRRDAVLRALIKCELADTSAADLSTARRALQNMSTVQTLSSDIDSIQRYFTSRPEHARAVVDDVVRLNGGYSKETILVTLSTERGPQQVVLRKVVDGRPAGNLPLEFDILRFVSGTRVPVAEPLWLELDSTALGTIFFASRRLPGRSFGDGFGPNQQVPKSAALETATITAHLHALDVRHLDDKPMVRMITRSELHAVIDAQQRMLSDVVSSERGIYIGLWRGVLVWLAQHVPPDDDNPVLVHGDLGFHNLLLDNGCVIGLVDWEHAHLGQREEDLAYIRPRLEGLLDWSEFLAAYRGAGGIDPDPAKLKFFTVWQDARNGIAALQLRKSFLQNPEQLSNAVVGMLLAPIFLRSALHNAFEVQPGPFPSAASTDFHVVPTEHK